MSKNTLTAEQRKELWRLLEVRSIGTMKDAEQFLEMALNTIDELESEIELYWKEQ